MRQLCFYFLLLFLNGNLVRAQHSFLYEGPIENIKNNGPYKILLHTELRKYMAKDFRDVRILDSANHEVPYKIISEALVKEKQEFTTCEIISQKVFKGYSEIIITNSSDAKISNLAFKAADSAIYKCQCLQGSEDTLQWFDIIDRQESSLSYIENYSNSYNCIYFPSKTYRYYRLKIDAPQTRTPDLISIGYFEHSFMAGQLMEVPFKSLIKTHAEQKITTIRLSFQTNTQVDRIDFKILNPQHYKRHASIYVNKTEKQKHKLIAYRAVLYEFDLAADQPLIVDVPKINETEIYIDIENKSDTALEIEGISCKQLATYLICNFDSLNHYTLKCGNTALKLPEYNFIEFTTIAPQFMPEAVVCLKEIPIIKPLVVEQPKSLFETKTFLWLCLALGAFTIIFSSIVLLKDMGKKAD